MPDAIIRHELVHVLQWARFGPLFLARYGASSPLAILASGDRYDWYWYNRLEMLARLGRSRLDFVPPPHN